MSPAFTSRTIDASFQEAHIPDCVVDLGPFFRRGMGHLSAKHNIIQALLVWFSL